MARPSRLSQWVATNPVIAIGTFLSGIFLILGICGTVVFLPNLRAWHAAASWPTTTAEITSSRLASATRGRTVRPDFTYRYTWNGRVYTTTGYDLLNVYSSDLESAKAALRKHPVGSSTPVLVNPAAPGQAVISRGETVLLVIYGVPPLFAVLGLIGGLFTTAGWLGWFDEKSRHPVGRATRAVGAVLLRESVLKPFFFFVVGSVILGLAVGGVMKGNLLLVLFAGVMVWGVWKASRKR